MILSELTAGVDAIVQSINLQESIKRRLMDVGLREGTVVQVCSKTLAGDNLYLKLDNDSCISINKNEASHIKIMIFVKEAGFDSEHKISDPQNCAYPNCIVKK